MLILSDDGDCADILTARALLSAVADGAMPDSLVAVGGTGSPPVEMGRETTVIDALHILQDNRCSHCLLRGANGEPAALLDVLQLVCAAVRTTVP